MALDLAFVHTALDECSRFGPFGAARFESFEHTAVQYATHIELTGVLVTDHGRHPVTVKYYPDSKNPMALNYLAAYTEISVHRCLLPYWRALEPRISQSCPTFRFGTVQMAATQSSLTVFDQFALRPTVDGDVVHAVVQQLAIVHGATYLAKRADPVHFPPMLRRLHETHEIYSGEEAVWSAIDDAFRKPAYLSIASLVDNVETFVKRVIKTRPEPESVVCVYTISPDTVLLGENVQFADWSKCRYASPALDLLTALYMLAPRDVRESQWTGIINQYYETLKEVVGDGVPELSKIQESFKTYAIFTLIRLLYDWHANKIGSEELCLEVVNDITNRFLK